MSSEAKTHMDIKLENKYSDVRILQTCTFKTHVEICLLKAKTRKTLKSFKQNASLSSSSKSQIKKINAWENSSSSLLQSIDLKSLCGCDLELTKTHLKTDLNATSEISCPTVLVTKRFRWLLPKIIQVFVDNNFVVNDFDLATV